VERDTLVTWFDEYMALFVALGRRDSEDFERLIEYFAVPMTLVIDDAFRSLGSSEEVAAFLRQMIGSMRAVDYGATETVALEVVGLSAGSALVKAELRRHSKSGDSLGGLSVGYLIAQTTTGRRICALTVANP
jgi:hypothetical protein